MPVNIPSRAALESNHEGSRAAAFRLAGLRSQAAVVRALADQVEHLSRAADAEGVDHQIIEEMARLGCRLLEAAAAFLNASAVGLG